MFYIIKQDLWNRKDGFPKLDAIYYDDKRKLSRFSSRFTVPVLKPEGGMISGEDVGYTIDGTKRKLEEIDYNANTMKKLNMRGYEIFLANPDTGRVNYDSYARAQIINAGGVPDIGEPRLFILDIETTGKEIYQDDITAIGVYDTLDDKYHILDVEHSSEKEILEQFNELIIKKRPLGIVGFNSNGFDLPFIYVKLKQYKLDTWMQSFGQPYKPHNKGGRMSFWGFNGPYAFFDLAEIYLDQNRKEGWIGLGALAEKLGLDTKIDVNPILLFKQKRWDDLREYLKQDLKVTKLVWEHYKDFVYTLLIKTHANPNRIFSKTKLLEPILSANLLKKNIIKKLDHTLKQPFEAGLMYPEADNDKGKDKLFLNKIVALDFKAQYPSIIKSFNLSPEIYTNEIRERYYAEIRDFNFDKKGIYPEIVEEFLTMRASYKKGSPEEQAAKVIANSVYGILDPGNPGILTSIEIVKTVAGLSIEIMGHLRDELIKRGHQIAKIKTDGIYFSHSDENEALDMAQGIVDKYIEETFNLKSDEHSVKLSIDAVYDKFYVRDVNNTIGIKKGKLDVIGGSFTSSAGAKGVKELRIKGYHLMLDGMDPKDAYQQIRKEYREMIINCDPEKLVDFLPTCKCRDWWNTKVGKRTINDIAVDNGIKEGYEFELGMRGISLPFYPKDEEGILFHSDGHTRIGIPYSEDLGKEIAKYDLDMNYIFGWQDGNISEIRKEFMKCEVVECL